MTDYARTYDANGQIIKSIKDEADCREVFRDFWPEHYREHGNSLCPFHDDRNPSLQISKDFAYCHSEQKKFDVIDLYKHATAGSTADAIRTLGKKIETTNSATLHTSKESRKMSRDFKKEFMTFADLSLSEAALAYLAERMIDSSRFPRKSMRFSLASDALNNTNRDALAFLITDFHGEPVGIQFIPIDGSDKMFAKGTKAKEAFFFIPGSGPLIITEGILDAASIAGAIPGASVASILGAGFTQKLAALRDLPESPVLFLDRDEAGEKATRKAIEILTGRVKTVNWQLAPNGCNDPNDLICSNHADVIRAMLAAAQPANGNGGGGSNPTSMVLSAAELCSLNFPDPQWIVSGILPEGLTILAGKPKGGKSWLSLNLCMSVASGQNALGKLAVKKGAVLYLALEDNNRRLQKRLWSILGDESPPDHLYFHTLWPKLDAGGLQQLEQWINDHPDTRLIVIDTLAKVRQAAKKTSGVYADDYEALGGLKNLVDKYAIAIVVVHHVRKAGAENIFDTVSGSTGLTGAADAIHVLDKGKGAADATLHVIGRDLEEQKLALKFDAASTSWTLLGDAGQVAKTKERQEVLDLLATAGGPLHYKEITSALRKKETTVKWMLSQMVNEGVLSRGGKGMYNVTNYTNLQTDPINKLDQPTNRANLQT